MNYHSIVKRMVAQKDTPFSVPIVAPKSFERLFSEPIGHSSEVIGAIIGIENGVSFWATIERNDLSTRVTRPFPRNLVRIRS